MGGILNISSKNFRKFIYRSLCFIV